MIPHSPVLGSTPAQNSDTSNTNNSTTDKAAELDWDLPTLLLAFVALVAGLVLRFYATSPLWLDEALSVNIAQLDASQLVEALRHDGHPPLYYFVLGWWIDAFGDGDLALRSLSGVFSVITVLVLYRVAKRYGRVTAQLTILLAAICPYLIRYGTEARMYSLLALLCGISWLSVERVIEQPTKLRLSAVAACCALLIYTHYWSVFLIAAALGVAVWNIAFGDKNQRALATRVGIAIFAGSATLLFWSSIFLEQLGSTGTPWAFRALPTEIAIETIQAIGGNAQFEGQLLGMMLVVLAILGSFAYRIDRQEVVQRFTVGQLDRAAMCVLLTLGLASAVTLLTNSAFEGRYSAVVVCFLIVLAARGLAMLPAWPRYAVLVIVVLFATAVNAYEACIDRTQGTEVAEQINQGAQAGDVVVFCPDQLGPATRRALTAEPKSFAYPRGNGQFVNWQNYLATISNTPVKSFVSDVLAEAKDNSIWMVQRSGYRGFGNSCQDILSKLERNREVNHLVVSGAVFEPMNLFLVETPLVETSLDEAPQ